MAEVLGFFSRPKSARHRRASVRPCRLQLCEPLEDRTLLSTYYVANSGANAAGRGTSPSTPWQTITYALAHIAAGDTVEIHTGIYREQFTLPYFTSTATTTIETDGSGPVIISGANQYTGSWSLYTAVTPTAGGTVYSTSYSGTSPQEVINSGTWLQEIGSESTVYADTAGGEDGRPERNPFGSNSVTSMVPDSFYFVPTAGQSSGGTLYIDLPTGNTPGSDVEISTRDGWVGDYTGSNQSHNYIINGVTFEYSNAEQDTTSSNTIPPDSLKMGNSTTLENCSILYADFGGIQLGNNDTIENCTIEFNGDIGIGSGGDNSGIKIFDNTIAYNNYRHFDPSWEAGGIKLIASGSGGYAEGAVYDNTIIDNYGDGIWSDSNNDNTATNELLIYNNYVAGNCPVPQDYASLEYDVGEAGIKIEVSDYVRVFNNIVVDNFPNGILISASAHTDVYNNTLVGNRGEAAIWAGGTPRTLGSTGTNMPLQYDDIENNIIYDNTATYDLDIQANDSSGSTIYAGNNTSNHNLFYRFGEPLQLSTGAYGGGSTITTLAAWTAATGDDAASLDTDPHLLNPSAGNYELGANSPAIGSGATLDLNGDGSSTDDVDYTGATRTTPFDIGAFKFISGSGNGGSDPAVALDSNAWVDDTLPTGAQVKTIAQGSTNGVWNWLSAATPSDAPAADLPTPAAESGDLSVIPLEESYSSTAAMSFESATQTMSVATNDDLYAFVYLDPADPPAEVMIQWKVGGTWRRAYWGANDITSFTGIESDDTGGTTVHVGNLPTTGGWVRLEVPAGELGITTAAAANGLSLDTYGGQAAFDDIGAVANAPIAQWTMNEGSGTAVDDTFGNDNGTFIGTAEWGAGVSGSDIVLNGSSYVDAGNGQNLSVASTAANPAMSISAWFNVSSAGTSTYQSLGIDKTGSYRLVAYDADTYENGAATRWQFYITDSSGVTHTCQTTIYYSNDVWHYVVGTYDGDGHLDLYVDGKLAAQNTWTGTYTLATTTNELDIGRRDQIARYYTGQIDEVNLFDQVLSASQITANFDSYFAEIPQPPAAPASFTATAGNDIVNLSWTAPAAPADDPVIYDIYRGTAPGGEAATPIAIGLTTPTFTDTTVTNGTTYYYTVVAINTGGASGNSNEASATPQAPSPPHVAAVLVSSTAWTSAFLTYLSTHNLGTGGYAIPTGSAQSAILPWTNINQIIVQFDQPVTVAQADLSLHGVTIANYSISSFSFSAATNTATWTLAAPIAADRLRIDVSDAVTNSNGQLLDGEWTNDSSTFPSGGAAGVGDFNFDFNVLPGDVDRNGLVNASDALQIRPLLADSTTSAGYSIWDDLDGNGLINASDALQVRPTLASTLPNGTP